MPEIRKTAIVAGLLAVLLFSMARAETADALLRVHGGWEKVDAGRVLKQEFRFANDQPNHWPRWADHRMYMDRVLTQAHAIGRDAIRRADSGARVGFDGVFDLNSWHGYDCYQLCRACDLVQVYACRAAVHLDAGVAL